LRKNGNSDIIIYASAPAVRSIGHARVRLGQEESRLSRAKPRGTCRGTTRQSHEDLDLFDATDPAILLKTHLEKEVDKLQILNYANSLSSGI